MSKGPESVAMAQHDIDYVLAKLEWMRSERVWPNGLRYLWTDVFALVLPGRAAFAKCATALTQFYE